MNRILPHMTPGRLSWLRHLRDHGPATRPKSVVGYQCMQLGWAAWWVTLDDGRQMFMDEARRLFQPPDFYWNHLSENSRLGTSEMITTAGVEALAREAEND